MAHDVTYVFTQKDKVQQERGALADMVALLTYVLLRFIAWQNEWKHTFT